MTAISPLDFDNILDIYNKERYNSLKKFGLNDEQCYTLIDLYLSYVSKSSEKKPLIYSHASLHACVNTPPCKDDEKPAELYKRKWCKNRKLKIGTDEFNKEAKKVIKQLEKDKMKNIFLLDFRIFTSNWIINKIK